MRQFEEKRGVYLLEMVESHAALIEEALTLHRETELWVVLGEHLAHPVDPIVA